MKPENFARATEIHKTGKYLMDHITRLTAIAENADKISRISFGTPYIQNVGELSFILGNSSGQGKQFDEQPERVQILTKAFVSCLLDAYRDELSKLTVEFDAL